MKPTKEEKIAQHRSDLRELYFSQLRDAGRFMTAVLEEAIWRLMQGVEHPKHVEAFVVEVEKSWRKRR